MQPIHELKKLAEYLLHMASEARERYANFPQRELAESERAETVVNEAKAVVKAVKELDVPPRSLFTEQAACAAEVNATVLKAKKTGEDVADLWTKLGRRTLAARRHPGQLRAKDEADKQYAAVETHFLQLRQRMIALKQLFPDLSRSSEKIEVSVPVKVHGNCSREHVWADRVGDDAARICNIPFFTDAFTRGDIVEIDAAKHIVRVRERAGRTRHATYEDQHDGSSFVEAYTRMAFYLHLHGIVCEGCTPGEVALFVPNKISDAEFTEICRRAPVLIRPVEPGTN